MSGPQSPILLADLGGTNARFALLEGDKITRVATLPVADYKSPIEAAEAYLAREGRGVKPESAAFAAAGPIVDGKVVMTNAHWVVDGEAVRSGLGLASARIVNDFDALARSVPVLGSADLLALGGGVPVAGAPIAVVGPGTGFGVAALIASQIVETVLVTEGGHATLPGEDKREDAIIDNLRQRLGHVSVEHVLSGDGLEQLYRAVVAVEAPSAPDQRNSPDIVAHAVAGDCAASVAALELFCAFLGAVAGNIALTFGARGGVFIGGGMALHFQDFLARSAFRKRFEAKGRFKAYLAAVPTALIRHPYPAFLGLARLLQHHPSS
jgi:glucokinase